MGIHVFNQLLHNSLFPLMAKKEMFLTSYNVISWKFSGQLLVSFVSHSLIFCPGHLSVCCLTVVIDKYMFINVKIFLLRHYVFTLISNQSYVILCFPLILYIKKKIRNIFLYDLTSIHIWGIFFFGLIYCHLILLVGTALCSALCSCWWLPG